LWTTRLVPDPKVFYCPSARRQGENWTYEFYSQNPNWPSTPAGSADDNIRTGYNYYPQSRSLEGDGMFRGLPKVAFKQADLDLNKGISTDLVHNLNAAPHKDRSIAGLNTLFGDGHVVFQSARRNPKAFDPVMWDSIGNHPLNFRVAMSLWRP
jgi:prepilin-type processing-associated H-X9-DG protein